MKKLMYGLILLAGVGVLVMILYRLPAVQDTLFRTAAENLLAAPAEDFSGMRVVICGSASPLGNDPARAQACIAVMTPAHLFIFDLGARSPLRIAQARLPLNRLTGVFITHYHSDHIAGLPDVNLASWVQGRAESLQVYGPEGVTSVVNGFNEAYRLDRSYRVAHHGERMLPPQAGPMTPVTITPEGVVWQDDTLKITSFPVAHPPIEPAVGYRVDYRGRSVVISGDTNASEDLFTAAAGADLLLHDALSRTLLDPMIETAEAVGADRMAHIMTDVIDYHADASSLAERAAEAGIGQLAYYHMVPVPANDLTARMFLRDLPEDIILVDDLQTFDLPPNTTEIIIH